MVGLDQTSDAALEKTRATRGIEPLISRDETHIPTARIIVKIHKVYREIDNKRITCRVEQTENRYGKSFRSGDFPYYKFDRGRTRATRCLAVVRLSVVVETRGARRPKSAAGESAGTDR